MGFWSKVKKVAKKVWRKVKAVARTVIRVIATIVGLVLGIVDLFFGFVAWPPKKLRLQIIILSTLKGPLLDPSDLDLSIAFAKKTLKDRFNVKLKPFGKNYVKVINEPAPTYALNVHCDFGAFKDEYKAAGEYFAKHVVGWNGVPTSIKFPLTVFVVFDVKDKVGCSLGPLSDYLTITSAGVKDGNTLVHEIGHSCSLWHSKQKANLMYENSDRGNKVKWYQKNLLRSSRHVLYW